VNSNHQKFQLEPPVGLFDRIILAIEREQNLRQARRLLFGFFALLVVSLVLTPFSLLWLVGQIKSSGVFYYFSTAIGNLGLFLALWQDFCLAILESLPVIALAVFAASFVVSLFTVRLFLRKKSLLLGYLLRALTGSSNILAGII
jgi:hypothetical protein